MTAGSWAQASLGIVRSSKKVRVQVCLLVFPGSKHGVPEIAYKHRSSVLSFGVLGTVSEAAWAPHTHCNDRKMERCMVWNISLHQGSEILLVCDNDALHDWGVLNLTFGRTLSPVTI